MGSFIQNQILGMQWLKTLIGKMLTAFGLDIESRIGGSVHFFLYDVIKITVLLFVLIFIISYIQSYFPPERSKKILSRCKGFPARVIAALLGTVTSFCSCSSIPLFMGFTTAGLPLGVTFSFLISSPMVDFASLILLTSIFGWKIAIAYVVLGLVVAVAGGTIIEHLHMEDQVADFIRNGKSVSLDQEKPTQKQRLVSSLESVGSTLKKVFPYILLSVAVGAVIHNWIPENWIINTLGVKNPLGVILAVFAGIPMYSDIFGCISISESLLAKGALLGVVLSFMMAVTTLSLPSLIMLKKAIKTKLLVIFVSICVSGIILVGYFFNAFQALFL
ncbi:MAG: permease [Spirochaetaceae bacterium]|nr:permease [Spirochaetaceae bacterium]